MPALLLEPLNGRYRRIVDHPFIRTPIVHPSN